jgi:hypothetical protein
MVIYDQEATLQNAARGHFGISSVTARELYAYVLVEKTMLGGLRGSPKRPIRMRQQQLILRTKCWPGKGPFVMHRMLSAKRAK